MLYVARTTAEKGTRAGLCHALGVATGTGVHVGVVLLAADALRPDPSAAGTRRLGGARYLVAGWYRLLDQEGAACGFSAGRFLAQLVCGVRRGRGVRGESAGVCFLIALLPEFLDPMRPALEQVAALGTVHATSALTINVGTSLPPSRTMTLLSVPRPHAVSVPRRLGGATLILVGGTTRLGQFLS